MDVPVERIERLKRWFRRAVALLAALVVVSVAQMAGWLAAVAGWIPLPLVDEAPFAEQLARQPKAVVLSANASYTHTMWATSARLARDAPLAPEERKAIARGLRAAGFERVYEPEDALPDGLVAQYAVSVTWTHPFLARTRQVVSWGDAVSGSEIEVVSPRVWVLVGWWPLAPEVTRLRWFDRENH